MSDSEDTVFVECDNGVAKYDREPSVEILHHNSDVGVVAEEVNTGEREDIVQAIEAVRQVKSAIQYPDNESLQEALDKIKERPRIDAEFQEKINMLKRIQNTENYSAFHDVVEEVLEQLTDAQERAKRGKTSLSRPIEILNEVLPVFEKACSVYTEKVESSPKVNQILRQLETLRIELKRCEQIDVGDVVEAKKLEKKCDKLLEEAVKHSIEDIERVQGKIREEEQADILTFFEDTRKETNDRMDFLTGDFEKMKNDCADDIKLTDRTLQIEIDSKERAFVMFETKDKELEEKICVDVEKEVELTRQLEEVQEHRRKLEEEKELRRAVQKKADVIHKQSEEALQELSNNLNDLLAKVDTANVVLKQTKDVCNMMFNKAVESKNMQNQDLKNVLVVTQKNRHSALIAQGVNCLNIQDRERGTIEMLREKMKKKKAKLQEMLKHRLESEAKKLTVTIKTMTSDFETSNKNLQKVKEKLQALKQEIAEIQNELDRAGVSYMTLDQAYNEFKKINEGDEGYSLPSMP